MIQHDDIVVLLRAFVVTKSFKGIVNIVVDRLKKI